MGPTFADFMQWGFYSLIAGAIIIGVKLLGELNNSVNGLNTRIAVLIERMAWHDEKLNAHDERLMRLENND